MTGPGRPGATVERLTSFDLMFLRLESDAWPCHFGGLAVVDGAGLVDAEGRLRTEALLAWLETRVARVRRLRQRVRTVGPLLGRPIWVDDPAFDVRHHLRTAELAGPGDEAELLAAAARAYARPLDRDRPLWELWFWTGLADGRVGVLLTLHHAVADGMAAVAVMSALFDAEPEGPDARAGGGAAGQAPGAAPTGTPPLVPGPTTRALLADRATEVGASARRAGSALAHPAELLARARRLARTARNFSARAAAPASSLNRPVRAGRRLGHLAIGLADLKAAGRERGGTVNDVVLTLWAGGIGRLLAARGEAVDGVELVAAVPVSLRDGQGGEVDNRTGTIVLPLPLGEVDPGRRLARIAETTRRTKATQRPAALAGFLAGLAGTPWGRSYVTRQRANNVIVTNIPGPRTARYLAGARVETVLPIIQLLGNVGLTLCAMSYAGTLHLSVTADAHAFADLDVLLAGMAEDWAVLGR